MTNTQIKEERWVEITDAHQFVEGEPYRQEHVDKRTATIYVSGEPWFYDVNSSYHRLSYDDGQRIYYDENWKPEPVLPTEVVWGFLAVKDEEWPRVRYKVAHGRRSGQFFAGEYVSDIIEFIPATKEQTEALEKIERDLG